MSLTMPDERLVGPLAVYPVEPLPGPSSVLDLEVIRAFPARPTSSEIWAEYTPDRVMRLARYVAARAHGRQRATAEQFDEDVSQCTVSIYTRINEYIDGNAKIKESYAFYYWLLFHVRTDLRDAKRREGRSLGSRLVLPLNPGMAAKSNSDPELPDTIIDVRAAMSSLTKKQQGVMHLYYVEHYSQTDIADQLGITQVAVNKLLQRGRERMQKALDPDNTGVYSKRRYQSGADFKKPKKQKHSRPGLTFVPGMAAVTENFGRSTKSPIEDSLNVYNGGHPFGHNA